MIDTSPVTERLIGVDVGGTKVSTAVLTDGVLGEPRDVPTEQRSAEALIEQLVEGVAIAAGDAPVDAVGVGIPSVTDWATGTARSSVNVPLQDVPLRAVLRERLGLPVFVDNDASLAALAEAHGEDGVLLTRDLVVFTIGTGVGGGIVIDGHVYRGVTGAAAELGHMIIGADAHDGRPDWTEHHPQPGSLEALASGRALDQLARERGHADGREAVRAAQGGDAHAIETVAILGRRLGLGIANAINLFDPEVVAIGGGVSVAGELLLGPARETAALFVLPGAGTRTEVRVARAGPRAGVRGAALLAGQELRLGGEEHTPRTIGETR